MKTDKKAINYYKSFYEVSKDLSKDQFYEFNMAIYKVMFFDEHINNITFKDNILNLLWKSVKHSIQSSVQGYCDKKNIPYDSMFEGGCQGGTQPPMQEEQEKEKEKEKKDKLFLEYKKENPKASENQLKIVEDFISYRKQIKDPIKTLRPIPSYLNALAQLHQKGFNINDCINEMKTREWITIKEEYFKNIPIKNKEVQVNENPRLKGIDERFLR